MGEVDPARLTDPGRPVFYPKVGHCIYRGVIEDRATPGTKLLELEDIEEGSRILVPVERVSTLGLRPAGEFLDVIKKELSSEFEPPFETPEERQDAIEKLVTEGSPGGLAKALKRLHLARQTGGLSREEEQTRRKIRSWLAAEVALARDCTRAEAQALITRVLQETMASHRRREREEAKERRRVAKAEAEKEAAETAKAAEAEKQAEPVLTEAGIQKEAAETYEATEPEEGGQTLEALTEEGTDEKLAAARQKEPPEAAEAPERRETADRETAEREEAPEPSGATGAEEPPQQPAVAEGVEPAKPGEGGAMDGRTEKEQPVSE